MSIGPMHWPGEGSTGTRQFTDREEFVGVFERAVSEPPSREYEVLVYYGVGGIGKTSLRKELYQLLKEWEGRYRQRTVRAVLDFSTPSHRDVETALFSLRQILNQEYKVQFPSFDLAYVVLWQKRYPQIALRQDPTRLEALLEEGSLFASLVSIVGEVPLVSLVPNIGKAILKTNRLLNEWWTKRGRQELNALHGMELAKIAEWLPVFWAADLKDYLEREGYLERKGRPAILFMDTYEALWEEQGKRTEQRFFAQDEWVRRLVAELPEVLWVITGREKLRWDEKDEDWRNYQQQHLVGGLAEEVALRFLVSCGITEEVLQEVIVEDSEGVPLYLDLAVDTYLQIRDGRQRDPSASDFQGTRQDVLDRFLHYLDLSETETLKVLSVARFWDRGLFESLIEEFNTSYPTTALQVLRRFSFVEEGQVAGTWSIHPLMREGLQERLNTELRGRVHSYLFDHYDQPLQELESANITDLHRTALVEAFHHAQYVLTVEGLLEWFERLWAIFDRAALWQFLIPLQEELCSVVENRLGSGHAYTATSLNNLAKLYREQGRYEESGSLHERALEIQEEVLGPKHPATAVSLGGLASVHTKRGRYEEARALRVRALAIQEELLGLEHPQTAGSLSNLASVYTRQGKYEEARLLYERALAVHKEILGPDHPDTATVLNNLGVLHHAHGRFHDAEPLLKRVLDIRERSLGPDHPDTIDILYNAAILYQDLLEQSEKRLGAEHPETLTVLNNLATIYDKQVRLQEAEALFKQALEVSEEILGPEHPDTALYLNNLALLYSDQRRFEEAEPLFKRALGIGNKVLGSDHPCTTSALEGLMRIYLAQGRLDEALGLTQ